MPGTTQSPLGSWTVPGDEGVVVYEETVAVYIKAACTAVESE